LARELSKVFVAELQALGRPTHAEPALEDVIREVLAAARAAWPGIELAEQAFLRYLAERVPANESCLDTLRRLHVADLFLACACAQGSSIALAEFEAKHMSQIGAFIARTDAKPAFADEVRQLLRDRLFVSSSAKILGYGGTGPLGAWLRVTAVRTALELKRGVRGGHVGIDDTGARAIDAPAPDPELHYMKAQYTPLFESAFQASLSALSAKERNILRQHFLDGMSTDAIAKLHRVHRTTVARWIEQTRQAILDGVHERLRASLGVGNDEIQSIMALVRSRLNVTIGRLLTT
jgi:RNA polymerase sigma-70 factor (ECF subfamily)